MFSLKTTESLIDKQSLGNAMNTKIELWFFYNLLTKTKLGPFSIEALCTLLINEHVQLNHVLLCQPGWKEWTRGLELPIFIKHYQEILQVTENFLPPLGEYELDPVPEKNNEDKELPPPFLGTDHKIQVNNEIQPIIENSPTEKKEVKNLPPPLSKMPLKIKYDEKIKSEIVNEIINKNKNESKTDSTNRRKHQRVDIELKAVFILNKKSFRTKTVNLSLGGVQIVDPLPDMYFNQKIEIYLSSPDLKISIKFQTELVANMSSHTKLKFTSQNEIGFRYIEAWLLSVQNGQQESIKKGM